MEDNEHIKGHRTRSKDVTKSEIALCYICQKLKVYQKTKCNKNKIKHRMLHTLLHRNLLII